MHFKRVHGPNGYPNLSSSLIYDGLNSESQCTLKISAYGIVKSTVITKHNDFVNKY